MTVEPLREYAKRINRRWSNQVIYLLDDDECSGDRRQERDDSLAGQRCAADSRGGL